ncbi:MAG TPA: hypothetical protein VHY91_07290 [Pirellulales bacterium]|jgi:hypothetical protein|nr:hypothetical protein [Pirellulales bacterium]
MKTYVKSSLTVGALAVAVLAMTQVASAQRDAAAKARGYYGAAASPDPADAIWLAPGITEVNRAAMLSTNMPRNYIPSNGGRSFSYAPAPMVARQAAPRAQAVRPAAPQAAAAAPAVSAPRRYSYSYQPRFFRNWRGDRVLSTQPENRNAASKAQGEY